jgi:cation transport ATPase
VPDFDITLRIQREHMYCSTCSGAIREKINECLKKQCLSCEFIATDLKAKTVEFTVCLPNKEAAELLIETCKSKLEEDLKITCISDRIESPHLELKQNEPKQNSPTENRYSWLSAFLLLFTGIAIIVAGEEDLLPSTASMVGLLANAGVGVVSTALTLWHGKHHLINAWNMRAEPYAGAMDSLISLGSGAALIYSFIKIFLSTFDSEDRMTYFDVPLITLGLIKLFHAIRDRIHANIETEIDNIGETKNLLPKLASVYFLEEIDKKLDETELKEEKLEQLFVGKIEPGSVIKIASNAIVPIDGKVAISREYSVYESFYGRKEPTPKNYNDIVYAGSVNNSSLPLVLITISKAEENHIRKTYKSVNKPPQPTLPLEIVSKYFFRGVLGSAAISAGGWALWGPRPVVKYVPQVFLSELLSACPCAFGLINVGTAVTKALAANHGLLIQTDRALSIDKVTDICIDKCGTLTTGNYQYKKTISLESKQNDLQLEEWLNYAVVLEQQIEKNAQTAPGQAILDCKKGRDLSNLHCSRFENNPANTGRGGKAIINNHEIIVGNKGLLKHYGVQIDKDWEELAARESSMQFLPIFFAIDNDVKCLFILEHLPEKEQNLRHHTDLAIRWLSAQGKTIHFLTGDNQPRTQQLQGQIGCDIIINCEQTPQNKVDYIKSLQSEGKRVLMVGDDDNDSNAIKQADIGVAIDSLVKVSSDADIVLNGSLLGLVQLMKLSKKNRQGYHWALFWAFGINSLSLSAASGVLYPYTKTLLDPMITISVMACSSLCLMINTGVFKYLCGKAIREVDQLFTSHLPWDSLQAPLLMTPSKVLIINESSRKTFKRQYG